MAADARENEYLLAAQVARLLHVSPKTVSRWAKEGKLPYVRTLGGHRRFPGAPIRELAERLASESMTIDEVLSQAPGGTRH
ncbi:MAG TPA: helix-turn-helix domain-containing protein [Actinomycetota bacterium]|nr:helix-turn-helix domain-containing protein [Actinomycetota bacterium]